MKTRYDVGQSVLVNAKIFKIVKDSDGIFYYVGITNADNETARLWIKEKHVYDLMSQKAAGD